MHYTGHVSANTSCAGYYSEIQITIIIYFLKIGAKGMGNECGMNQGKKVNSNRETVFLHLQTLDLTQSRMARSNPGGWQDLQTQSGKRDLSNILHMHMLAGEDDLRDVISAVTDLTGRWKDLGISLGVRPSDLDTILSNNPHSSSNCLRDMLLQWLKQSYNVCTTDVPFSAS